MAKESVLATPTSSGDPKEQRTEPEADTKTDGRTDTENVEDFAAIMMQLGQIKIIPKVRKCNFSQFKNRYKAEEEGICAIDVLECGNYLDEEIDKEFKLRQTLPHKKAKNRSQDARLPRLIGLEKGERPSDFKMVLRIRIQSPRLLAILARVMQESWESRPRTFYRGFSPLVYFHPQVLEVLRDLKVKYGGSDTDRTPRVGSDKESEPQEPSEIQIAHDSPEALAELQCYVDYMESEVLPLYSQFEKLDSTSNCKIRFKDLWYLFRPGELAYRPIGAGENKTSSNLGLGQRVWRIISVRPPLADYRITSSNHRNFFGDEEEDEHKTSFGVQGYYIDYTGDEFCVVTENFEIQPYHGERPIDTLKIFPIRFVANHQEQLRFMTGHGRHFIRTLKTRHATYNWWTITKSPRGNPTTDAEGNILKRSEYIDSEVIVDFVEAFQTNPSWKPTPSILKAESDPDQTTALDPFLINWWSDRERTKLLYQTDEVVVLRSAATSYERNVNLGRDPFLVHVRENDKNNRLTTAEYLTEQDMALLPSRLFAYVLRDRRFVQLDITRLGPVKKSADAFDCLKIKRRYKDMIQSLVDDHFDKKALDRKDGVERATLDWIKGKGKGLFILFHGAPGVGKTATAEAVAQANGKPLFSITCGDLGLTPGDVEVALQRIFRLANTWDCVLLLDEVDTFFSQRTRGDSNLAKNALVSVFLRVLEYYDGLLFLTTNRPGTLDEAFKSRIHLTLYYPPLDFSQTMDIWQLNIDRLRIVERERCRETTEGKHNHHDAEVHGIGSETMSAIASNSTEIQASQQLMQIDEQEILRFAEERYSQNNGRAGWNGRQIRNAFQIASSLAHFDARRDNTRPRLTIDHFKMIQLVTEDFDRFMQETVGKTDAEQAFERGDRADHWNPDHARAQALLQSYSSNRDASSAPSASTVGLGLGQRQSLGGRGRPSTPLENKPDPISTEPTSIFNPQRRPSPHPNHRSSLGVQSPTITFSGPPGMAFLDREPSPRRESNDRNGDEGYSGGRQDSDFMFSGAFSGRKRPREGSDPDPLDWRRMKRRDYDDPDS